MTRLCLVRHARTDWNEQGRWQGQSDGLLNALGWQQVRELIRELAGEQFEAVYSSDLRRARSTARAVARLQHLPVQTDARLREINLGEWEGQLGAEIPLLYPREWEERQRRPLDSHPPGGESVLDLAQRALPFFEEICARHPGGDLLVVSHGLLLGVYLCHVLRLPLEQSYARIPENAHPIFVEFGA